MVLLMLLTSMVLASVHYVPSDFTTIQTAIDASVDGDSIMVLPGNYFGGFDYEGKNVHIESTQGPESTHLYGCHISFTSGEGRGAVLKGFEVSGPVSFDGLSIEVEGADPSIINNYFRYYYWCFYYYSALKDGSIIKLTNSSALIEGNLFFDNFIYWDAWDKTDSSEKSSVLKGLCIYVHQDQDSNMVEIRNNSFISNCIQSYGVYPYGLCVYINGQALLANNLFYDNGSTTNWYSCIGTAVCIDSESVVDIENSVFCNNFSQGYYAVVTLEQSECNLSNCIARGNMLLQSDSSSLSVEYSNVEGGYTGTGNIDVDPQFCTGLLSDFHLDPASPCIDAGNPDQAFYDPHNSFEPGYALWPSLGTVINDMGLYGGAGAAYWSEGGTLIESSEQAEINLAPVQLLNITPNPVQTAATIEFTLAESSLAKLSIYDVTGRVMYQQENQYLNGANELLCPDLENGFYLCRIEVSSFAARKSFLVLR